MLGLRVNVLRNDPPRAEKEGKDGFVSLETIAEQADIVTFHTPLTKEGRFATLPPGRRRLLPQAPTKTLVRQRIQRSRP